MGEICFICKHHEDSHGSSGYGDIPYCEQNRCECGNRCMAWDEGLGILLDLLLQAPNGWLCNDTTGSHDAGCDCIRAKARSLIYRKR